MTDKPKPRPPRPGINPFPAVSAPAPKSFSRDAERNAVERAARDIGTPAAEASLVAKEIVPPKVTRVDVVRQLSGPTERDRLLMRTYKRYKQLIRFRTARWRRRLVIMLERELTGQEYDWPKAVMEAVEHMVASDAKEPPDVKPIASVAGGRFEYERIVRELRAEGLL